MFKRQVLLRAPPKSVFQLLLDVTTLEDYTPWKITPLGDSVGVDFQWTERKGLTKRTWTVTEFDRRGFRLVATWKDITMTLAAKKGGPGSCNAQMRVDGPDAAVAKFEKTDGDRMDRLKAWVEDSD